MTASNPVVGVGDCCLANASLLAVGQQVKFDGARKVRLTDRSLHGLRKSAARRLAEAGCSTKQIAAVTGHASLREVERYTLAAEQERLARDAVNRLAR